MGHHDDGLSRSFQRGKQVGQLFFENGVDPLGRLVQKQDLRFRQQHLGQRGALQLAAAQIERVAAEQRLQAEKIHQPAQPRPGGRPAAAGFVGHVLQILPDGASPKQVPGVLRQAAEQSPVPFPAADPLEVAPQQCHFSPVRPAYAADDGEQGGFSHAVSAEDAV